MRRKLRKKDKGFTLIELIIAIAVLVILTGLLAPQFMKYIEQARRAKTMHMLENIRTMTQTAYVDAMEAGEFSNETGAGNGEKVFISENSLDKGSELDQALSHFLQSQMGDAEFKKVSIVIDMGAEGKDEYGSFNYMTIVYYTSEDRNKFYYYETMEEGKYFPGTFGESIGKDQYIQWKE